MIPIVIPGMVILEEDSAMTPDELRTLLAETLDDCQLSRSEKRALTARLKDTSLSEADQVLFQRTAFELAARTISGTNTRSVLEWLDEVTSILRRAAGSPQSAGEADVCFSPGEACWTRIAGLLRTSRQKIDICVFTVTDNRITREILETHRRGVEIRVITDNDKSNDQGSDIGRLAESGLRVRVDRTSNHMHHKFALFDNARLLTGSYNWTRSAADYNEENLIVTSDPRLVGPFQREFDRLWNICDPY